MLENETIVLVNGSVKNKLSRFSAYTAGDFGTVGLGQSKRVTPKRNKPIREIEKPCIHSRFGEYGFQMTRDC